MAVGYQMKSAFEGGLQGLPDWRSNVPYSLDSYQRHIYRKPEQQAELRGNITRYASNRTKAVPACGGGMPFTFFPFFSKKKRKKEKKMLAHRERVKFQIILKQH